jgi:hypothetical protein
VEAVSFFWWAFEWQTGWRDKEGEREEGEDMGMEEEEGELD